MSTPFSLLTPKRLLRYELGHATDTSLHERLADTDEIQKFRYVLSCALVSDDDIRTQVQSWCDKSPPGERSYYDICFAGLAVALEDNPSELATQFLEDLASENSVVLLRSSGVGRVCLENRSWSTF